MKVPCLHEVNPSLPPDYTVADHHPLTREEVIDLLRMAKDSPNPLASEIQCRLVQAVPGQVCPHQIDGPVARRTVQLHKLYVEHFRRGADPCLVDTIMELLSPVYP